jgi:hypothetical protein
MTIFRVVAAVALIVGTGLVHGAWTGRWGRSKAVADVAQRIESVPMEIGEWTATGLEIPAPDRQTAGSEAYLARRYLNRHRGTGVSVTLLAGQPGRISAHTPDACFPSAGYSLTSLAPFQRRYGPDARRAELQTAVALHEGPNPAALRIFWSWNAGKGWTAPAQPRWEFAQESVLCKLYVVRESTAGVVEPGDDPCNDFLGLFLPELDRCVFSMPR